MCDERERLIDYLYSECGADERRRVELHLESCDDCREEIRGLRGTREDLLAWDVPDRGSVWKPFAPPRVAPAWRDVPRWALAAAASVMFLIGAAGGFATRALFPLAAAAPAQAASRPSGDPQFSAQQIRDLVRAELDQRAVPVSTTAAAPAPAASAAAGLSDDELLQRVQQLIAVSEQRQKTNFLAVAQDMNTFRISNREALAQLTDLVNRHSESISRLNAQTPGR